MVPFVVETSELEFCLCCEVLEVGCGHYGDLSLHFSSQDDVFGEVGNAVDCRLEVIDCSWFGLIEDPQRLHYSEIHGLSA